MLRRGRVGACGATTVVGGWLGCANTLGSDGAIAVGKNLGDAVTSTSEVVHGALLVRGLVEMARRVVCHKNYIVLAHGFCSTLTSSKVGNFSMA